MSLSQWVSGCWYQQKWWCQCLWPFAWLFEQISKLRRVYLERFVQKPCPIPVIVVGNLTVGGVGKTPFVIALAQQLTARGLRVGIVSRGYRATIRHFPHQVTLSDTAMQVGDEPLLLVRHTQCPVVIAPKRVQAVNYLIRHCQSQVVISDDGLQHYALSRALEIVIIDGQRGFGNELCLPAGPLREPKRRVLEADFVVINDTGASANNKATAFLYKNHPHCFSMQLLPGAVTQLMSGQPILPTTLKQPVAAVAAIGHPERFYATLQTLSIAFKPYTFADHYRFQPHDLQVAEKTIVMTEKDAVKCISFATDSMYFLPVVAKICDKFWEALWLKSELRLFDNHSSTLV